MKQPYWTASGGRKIPYRELEDAHLQNIIKDGYRNPHLEIEAKRRGLPLPERPVDKLTTASLMMWLESFTSCAIEGNALAEKMIRLYETNKPVFFFNLNHLLEHCTEPKLRALLP